jgi:hypothetical protein
MKYHLAIVCVTILATTSSHAVSSEYPKSRAERRLDEMGSITGGEGVVFHLGKIRNESTKTEDSKVNQYLWDASVDELGHAPLIVKDHASGIISTDWYSSKEDPNHATRTTVKITGNVIAPEALEIKMQQRIFKNGRWLEEEVKTEAVLKLEEVILRKSRDLYIKSK